MSLSVRKRFERYDLDHNGRLSVEELGQLLGDLGAELPPPGPEYRRRLAEMMTDISHGPASSLVRHGVSWPEFIEFWRARCVKLVFSQYDSGDGTVPAAMFADMCHDLGVEFSAAEATEALQLLDPTRSGEVRLSTFLHNFQSVFDSRRTFDQLRDGSAPGLTMQQFKRLIHVLGGTSLSDTELRCSFERLDVAKSDFISFEEFLPWWITVREFGEKRRRLMRHRTTQGSNWEAQAFLADLLKTLDKDAMAMGSPGVTASEFPGKSAAGAATDDLAGSVQSEPLASTTSFDASAVADCIFQDTAEAVFQGGSASGGGRGAVASRQCSGGVPRDVLPALLRDMRTASGRVLAGDALGAFTLLHDVVAMLEGHSDQGTLLMVSTPKPSVWPSAVRRKSLPGLPESHRVPVTSVNKRSKLRQLSAPVLHPVTVSGTSDSDE